MHRCSSVTAIGSVLVALVLSACGGSTPGDTTRLQPGESSSPAQARPKSNAAAEVVTFFKAEGLPVPNPRDNTGVDCMGMNCAQLMTTDTVSVYAFPDLAGAKAMAKGFGDSAHRNGRIVLSYSAAQTPTADQRRYERALRKMLKQ